MLDPGATLRVVLNSFPSDFSASPSPTSRRTAARLRLCVCPQQQFLPTEKQIDQRASDKQPMRVLLQSAVAQLHKSELQLHHLKYMLHLRTHSLSLEVGGRILASNAPTKRKLSGCRK